MTGSGFGGAVCLVQFRCLSSMGTNVLVRWWNWMRVVLNVGLFFALLFLWPLVTNFLVMIG